MQSRVKSGGSVIILGQHVDYWDHLGWKDPYSSAAASTRQYLYANTLGLTVFTPQVVVDGAVSATGNDRRGVESAINRCRNTAKAKIVIKLDRKGPQATITCIPPRELDGKRAQLQIAVTEDNLKTKVSKGENNGATLAHTAVVRSLQKVGLPVLLAAGKPVNFDAAIAFDKAWKKNDLRIVVFLQDPTSLKVLGAEQLALE